MSNKSVFCIATSRGQADEIVARLTISHFSNRDISVLFADKKTSQDFAHDKHTKAPEGAVTGAGTGGVIGGSLGWIVGIGALAIPGVGPFIAAGPIMAALSGGAIGATMGGIAGGLIGLGLPEIEARRYAGKLKDGNILISVHTDDSDEIKQVKEIFSDADGEDICTSSESSKGDQYDEKPGGDWAKTGTVCISNEHRTGDLTTATGMPVRGSHI
ncbi:MAG: DUF3341 domain-containing protein [Kiritimatiellia bacterium]